MARSASSELSWPCPSHRTWGGSPRRPRQAGSQRQGGSQPGSSGHFNTPFPTANPPVELGKRDGRTRRGKSGLGPYFCEPHWQPAHIFKQQAGCWTPGWCSTSSGRRATSMGYSNWHPRTVGPSRAFRACPSLYQCTLIQKEPSHIPIDIGGRCSGRAGMPVSI